MSKAIGRKNLCTIFIRQNGDFVLIGTVTKIT